MVRRLLTLVLHISIYSSFLMGCILPPEENSVDTTTPSTPNIPSVPEGYITLSGDFDDGASSSAYSKAVSAQSIDYGLYKVYCLTFTNPAAVLQTDLNSDGSFSLYVPMSTPMGCFINLIASNTPIATLVITDGSSGFGSGNSSSLNLDSNANLGSLNLDLEAGVVEIPIAQVQNEMADTSAPSLNLADLHDNSYTMSCLASGNTILDQACSDFLSMDGDSIYFRIMNATDGSSNPVNGMGVWRSQSDFAGCGSIDMTDTEASSIESGDGITFDVGGVATNSAFVDDQVACETRDGLSPTGMDSPRYYYAAGPLSPNGNGYTLHVEDEFDLGDGCYRRERVSVTFRAENATDLVGNFTMNENYIEAVADSGACDARIAIQASFNVLFTEQ